MTPSASLKKSVASDINQVKSRLIDQLKKLESEPGCKAAAKELGSIIGRLEHWQAKHT
jgi:hypothetical protein